MSDERISAYRVRGRQQRYGLDEALERGVPNPNAARFSLTRRREQRNEPPTIPIDLPNDAVEP